MIIKMIGAIVFTVGILFFINFIGDMAIQPQSTMSEATVEEAQIEPKIEPQAATPAPKPETEPAAAPEAAPPVVPAPPVSVAMPAGDVAKGQKLFRKKCMSCHTFAKGEKDRTGPNLWTIVNRPKAASENFRYSKTMKMFGGVWSEAELSSFIAGPRTFMPDTKMTFAGLKKEADRMDVIAFLKTLTD